MARDLLGLIQLLQILLLVLRQDLPPRSDGLLDPLDAAKPNNRTGHALVDPGKSDMCHGPVVLLCNLNNPADDVPIEVRRPVASWLRVLLPFATARRSKVSRRAREVPAAQRRPWDKTDARVVAEAVHLALLLAVEQVVVILHADELCPAVALGDELHARELRGPHATGADVANLARLHEVVERAHRLLDRRGGVEAVDLEEVEVGRVEAGEGGVDLVENGGAGEAIVVDIVFGRLDGRFEGEVAGF